MVLERSFYSTMAMAFIVAVGLLLNGCSEQGDGAASGEDMTMDEAEDEIKDGIDPQTGNPPEL